MDLKKYKYQASDLLFDDEAWNTTYLPKIKERINAAIAKLDRKQFGGLEPLQICRRNPYIKDAQQLRDYKALLVNTIAPSVICREVLRQDFGYTHIGMFSKELVQKNKEFSDFDWTESLRIDNYSSSWGIFNNHLIVNKATCTRNQMTSMFQLDFTFQSYYRQSVLFTNLLPELKFSFNGVNTKKVKSSIFENKDFASQFIWSWNDDIKFLMYATPHFQDQFVKINKGFVRSEFKIFKKNSFILNEYKQKFPTNSFDASAINLEYITNKIDTKQYLSKISNEIIEFCHDKYRSLAFATIIPIIDSEYQTKMINKMIRDTAYLDVTKNAHRLLLYLIAENQIISYNAPDEKNKYQYRAGRASEKVTKKENDYAIIEVMRIDLTRLLIENYANSAVPKCTDTLGYLYTSKVDSDILYHNSQYWNTSNLDEVSTFKLDLIYDKMFNQYGLQHLIIDNGYISMLVTQPNIDEKCIDDIMEVILNCEVQDA